MRPCDGIVGGPDAAPRPCDSSYFLVVDGRQPGRSEGATEQELGQAMKAMGATDAISLDGGGSSILVVEQNGGARVVNRPVGIWDQPGTVRCIGNAVGLQFQP